MILINFTHVITDTKNAYLLRFIPPTFELTSFNQLFYCAMELGADAPAGDFFAKLSIPKDSFFYGRRRKRQARLEPCKAEVRQKPVSRKHKREWAKAASLWKQSKIKWLKETSSARAKRMSSPILQVREKERRIEQDQPGLR